MIEKAVDMAAQVAIGDDADKCAIGIGDAGADWLRAAVLLAGMAFCFLKVADVAALRLKRPMAVARSK